MAIRVRIVDWFQPSPLPPTARLAAGGFTQHGHAHGNMVAWLYHALCPQAELLLDGLQVAEGGPPPGAALPQGAPVIFTPQDASRDYPTLSGADATGADVVNFSLAALYRFEPEAVAAACGAYAYPGRGPLIFASAGNMVDARYDSPATLQSAGPTRPLPAFDARAITIGGVTVIGGRIPWFITGCNIDFASVAVDVPIPRFGPRSGTSFSVVFAGAAAIELLDQGVPAAQVHAELRNRAVEGFDGYPGPDAWTGDGVVGPSFAALQRLYGQGRVPLAFALLNPTPYFDPVRAPPRLPGGAADFATFIRATIRMLAFCRDTGRVGAPGQPLPAPWTSGNLLAGLEPYRFAVLSFGIVPADLVATFNRTSTAVATGGRATVLAALQDLTRTVDMWLQAKGIPTRGRPAAPPM